MVAFLVIVPYEFCDCSLKDYLEFKMWLTKCCIQTKMKHSAIPKTSPIMPIALAELPVNILSLRIGIPFPIPVTNISIPTISDRMAKYTSGCM